MRCKSIRKQMVAFLYGELERDKADALENHCLGCAGCRDELDELRGLSAAADALKPEIEEAVSSIDWSRLPEQIAVKLSDSREVVPSSGKPLFWKALFQPGFRPVMAGVLIGVLIGAMAMLVLFRGLQNPPESAKIVVPQGFLDRIELQMAHRDTIDYLEQSEYLLLDFVQSGPGKVSEFWASDFSVRRTQNLLSKKKYINSQLDKYKMIKARAICDQIELLFYELTQLRDDLNEAELELLRSYIEQKQILMKIKLVKKELEQSEV
jgi:hypothetical protein